MRDTLIRMSRVRRRLAYIAAGLAGALVLLAAAGAAFLALADLRPMIERAATSALGRPATMGALTIGWGNPLVVEARDVVLANAAWSDAPEMLRVARLSAALDLPSLLRGVVHYDRLRIEGANLLLERAPDGQGNWTFGAGRAKPAAKPNGGLALVPKNRTQFPDLPDFALSASRITWRAAHRPDIVISLADATIKAAAGTAPARLVIDGAYNGAATRVVADTASFATLRDAATPFPAKVQVVAAGTTLRFDGTLDEPLDFDGVRGALDMSATSLRDLGRVFGGDEAVPAVPARLAGDFTKQGDDWQAVNARGAVAASAYTGSVELREGNRGVADAIDLDLNFPRLDLTPLFTAPKSGGGDTSLRLEPDPGTTLRLALAAGQVTWRTWRATDVVLRGQSDAKGVAVEQIRLGLFGGRLEGSLRAEPAGPPPTLATRLAADLTLTGADLGALATLLEAGTMRGRLDGRLTLNLTGDTLPAALRRARGQAWLTLGPGSIARDLLEKASVDVRALFRRGEGQAAIACGIALVNVADGIARIAPLRLVAEDLAFAGEGAADLAGGTLELLLRSSGGGALALNTPIRLAGTLDDLKVTPWLGPLPPLAEPALPAGLAGHPCRAD